MESLRVLAEKLRVVERMDFEDSDAASVASWKQTLSSFDDVLGRVSRLNCVGCIDDVDAHSYVGLPALVKGIRVGLHEEYDFGPVCSILAKAEQYQDRVVDVGHVLGEVDDVVGGEGGVLGEVDDVVGGDCHVWGEVEKLGDGDRLLGHDLVADVVDIDYENTPRGACVFLYTRVSGSTETALVVVPFKDYFYVQLTGTVTESLVKKKVSGYEWFLREKKYGEFSGSCPDKRRHFSSIRVGSGALPLVAGTEVVEDLRSLYGYQPYAQRFLKVTCNYPAVTLDLFRGLSKKHPDWCFFEAETDYINKFLTKHKLSGCAAVCVRSPLVKACNDLSTCDMLIEAEEVDVCAGDVTTYVPRYLYYDLECMSLDPNIFPEATVCPVIQISYLGAVGQEEFVRGVLCLHDTPGALFESFDTEAQLLIRFMQLIRVHRVDALVSYNGNCFDMPYILDRLDVLGVELAKEFSRRKGLFVRHTRKTKSSKQAGTTVYYEYTAPGIIMFDLYEILKGDVTKKLQSYSLKSVCAIFLEKEGANKEDLRYRDIPVLFQTAEGRSKIASYCLQDTVLLPKLEKVFMYGTQTWSMARVLGVSAKTVLTRGLTHKLMCKLKQYTERFNLLIPSFNDGQRPVFNGTYKGAFVLDPDVGFYEDPVAVLDYASLYPSLMIYYNLSYDTIVFDKEWMASNPDKFDVHNGVPFVKTSVHFGVLPLLEQELAIQRKLAKAKLKAAPKGSMEAMIFDGEQNAAKVVMNSLYGMCGSPNATVPCVEVAATITGMGRQNLLEARDYVNEHYPRITGFEGPPARVIYGDTDSIFILMPGTTLAQSVDFAKLLMTAIGKDLYDKPNALVMEAEKVLVNLMLCTAKRYAARCYPIDLKKAGSEHTYSKMSCTGLQMQKRDSTVLCKETMSGFFDKLIMQGDKAGAIENVRAHITKLYAEELPLSYFKLTKKISKPCDKYVVIPPHVKAWERQVRRLGEGESPSVGEQFDYVVTRIDRKKKGLGHAMVDYPLADQSGLSAADVDKDKYMETQISNPLTVPLSVIMGKAGKRALLDPSNYLRKNTIKAAPGNLLGFFGRSAFTTTKSANKRPPSDAEGIETVKKAKN